MKEINIHIDGILYKVKDLLDVSKKVVFPEYVQEVSQFLKEWYNEKDYITAQTSGSTGRPKQVVLPKAAMILSAKATGSYFSQDQVLGPEPPKKILSPLSVNYIAGKMMLVRAINWNADIYMITPTKNPLARVDQSFDFMVMTPHQLQEAIDSELIQKTTHIRQILLGGSAVSKEQLSKLQKLSCSFFIGYGMTETTSHIALRRLNGLKKSEEYEAVQGIRFTQDNRSCLVIHSDDRWEGPLITNDVVELKSEKSFIWKGRFDHVINSGGIKLHPEIIEEKLREIISTPFYITSQEDKKYGEKLVLLIEGSKWSEIEIKDLKEKINHKLSKYEVPKKWIFEQEFDRTPTGKIKRKRL